MARELTGDPLNVDFWSNLPGSHDDLWAGENAHLTNVFIASHHIDPLDERVALLRGREWVRRPTPRVPQNPAQTQTPCEQKLASIFGGENAFMRTRYDVYGKYRGQDPLAAMTALSGVAQNGMPADFDPVWDWVGHPGFGCFRGSIPCLHFPLSTLRRRSYERRRMTRGRYGWLVL
jgi:hypothetical protein